MVTEVEKRTIARGVRMSEDLWSYVDCRAAETGDDSGSRLIARLVREDRDRPLKEVAQQIAAKGDYMRHLELVGRQKNNEITLAKRCAWCRKWLGIADYVAAHRDNAQVSHGCCPSCARKLILEVKGPSHPKPAA